MKKVKGLTKRIVAMLMSGMLVVGAVPGTVLASENQADIGQTSEIAAEVPEVPGGADSEEVSAEAYGQDAVTQEVEAEAQYYTVTLDANGGYFENEWDDALGETVEQAEVVEKHIPVGGNIEAVPVFTETDQDGQLIQNMVFAGWSLERDGELITMGDEGYVPVDNCVLYAVWQNEDEESEEALPEDSDNLNTDYVGEDNIQSDVSQESKDNGDDEELPEGSAEVDEASGNYTAPETEEKNATESYTVTLDANGGYFENEWDDVLGESIERTEILNKVIPIGETVSVIPLSVQGELEFLGWSLEKDGELVAHDKYAFVPNCTLFAVWEEGDLGNTEEEKDVPRGNISEELNNTEIYSDSAGTQDTTASSTFSEDLKEIVDSEDINNSKLGLENKGDETEVKGDEAENNILEEKADEENVSTAPMWSSEPVTGVHMWYQYNGNIDIRGYTGSSTIQTTYSNRGYSTVLQCDGNKETLQFNQNGQAVSHASGLTVTPNVEFSSDDKYAIVRYTVKNTSSTVKTYNLGVCADVDIDSDDHASVYSTDNGLRMVDRSSGRTYYLLCKNINEAASADTIWFGYYGNRFDNIFNSTSDSELTAIDSGLAFSWKDQVLSAGGTTSYVYQIGIGEAGAIVDYVPAKKHFDRWKFTNAENGSYFMSWEDKNKLFENSTILEAIRLTHKFNTFYSGPYEGSCYGMACLASLVNGGKPAAFIDGRKSLEEYDTGNDKVISCINFYQMLEYMDCCCVAEYEFSKYPKKEQISRIETMIKENSYPVLIGYGGYTLHYGLFGHAVVGYDLEEGDFDEYVRNLYFLESAVKITNTNIAPFNKKIVIYDPNFPDGNDKYDFYYNDNGDWCVPGYGLCSTGFGYHAFGPNNGTLTIVTNDIDIIEPIRGLQINLY